MDLRAGLDGLEKRNITRPPRDSKPRSGLDATAKKIFLFHKGTERRIRWAGHVARMGEMRGVHKVLVVKPEGKRQLGRHRHRRIILRWNFRKWDVGVWTGSSWLRIGKGGGTCECGNEPSGSIKCGEFLDYLTTC